MPERIVTQLPSTSGISDPQVRTFLDQLTNHLALRNGDLGNGDNRFITAKEFRGLSQDAIIETFGSAGGGPGGSPIGAPPKPIDQIIRGLTDSILRSELFNDLGQHIRRISAPWETIDLMNSTVAKLIAGIGTLKNGITRIDTVTTSTVTTVTALSLRTAATEASIIQINTISASSTSQSATALFALTTRMGTTEANITQLNTLTNTTTSATAQAIYQIRASMGNLVRTYWQATQPTAGPFTKGDQWFNTSHNEDHYYWDGGAWVLGGLPIYAFSDAGILTESTARVTADTAVASAINHIWATMGGVSANIQDGLLTDVNAAQVAFALRWTTVQASVYDFVTNTNKVVAVDQRISTTIDQINNKISGKYEVRVEVGQSGRTVVGGFGIIGALDAAGGTNIDFGVRADRFWIAAPTTASGVIPDIKPFIYQSTSGSWGPPGIYIDSATITNASISIAKIENQIQSINYNPATPAGWFINSVTGNAEFNNVLIRGTSTVGRLNVTGAVEGQIFVDNNSTATVTHGENRKVMLTYWSDSGTPSLSNMTDNSFTFALSLSGGGYVHYRYF